MQTEPPVKARQITPEEIAADNQHERLRQYVEQSGHQLHHLPPYSDVKGREDAPPMYVGPACPNGCRYYGEPRAVRYTRDHTCVLCTLGYLDRARAARVTRAKARTLEGGKIVCKHCGKARPRRAFSDLKASPNGKARECRACKSELNREYYQRRQQREHEAVATGSQTSP